MWDLVPCPGIESRSPPWERGVLATGPPGKSQTPLHYSSSVSLFRAATVIVLCETGVLLVGHSNHSVYLCQGEPSNVTSFIQLPWWLRQ